ncbi:MAG: hypothetical protein NC110_00165 [Ruminococcus sp.]|nr:hypothetical protein [Ruminococcus sp.]
MKSLFVFLCAVLMLAMASCTDGNVVSGYVVGKRHNPARCYTTRDPATQTTRIRNIPEMWVLYVADSTAVRTIHVDKPTFESAVKGETIRLRYGKESK